GAARDFDACSRSFDGSFAAAGYFSLGAPIRMAAWAWTVDEDGLRPQNMGLHYTSSGGVVHSCGSDLDLARAVYVPGNSHQRACAHCAAFELLPFRAAVLVGAVLCAWTAGLRRGGLVRVYDCSTHKHSRRAAYVRAARM